MNKKNIIINLYRKIICSLLCINKKTSDETVKIKASNYLDQFLEEYEIYLNKGICFFDNYKEIIDFCNECYGDKDVFDFAEDVEYGLKELYEITINEGGK